MTRPGAGFRVVFVLDLWERFSFYGLAAILVLYLVSPVSQGGVGMPAVDATAVFGAAMSLAFVSGLPGGWLTDRVLGPRRAALAGGGAIAAGHFVLALPATSALYLGLACIAVGTGLVKPATAALVDLTTRGRATTEAAFSVFYISIQVSALLAPLVVGVLAERVSWHAGFAAAGAGMTAGLLWFVIGMRRAGGHSYPPANPLPAPARRRLLRAAVPAAVVAGGGAFLVTPGAVLVPLGLVTLLAGPAFVGYLLRAAGLTPGQRRRTVGLAWLLAASSGFWMIFAQDASVLGLFARDSIDRTVAGWQLPAAWFQSLHPLFVLLLAPIAAWSWTRAAHRAPAVPVTAATPMVTTGSTPVLTVAVGSGGAGPAVARPPAVAPAGDRRRVRSGPFAAALCAGGASFVLMAVAAWSAVDGPVSPLWLTGAYLLQAGGELVIGPAGLALAARLAPPGRTGQYLGLYGLFAAFGVVLGNQLYRLTGVLTLPTYLLLCGGLVVALSAALALAAPTLDRLLGGRS